MWRKLNANQITLIILAAVVLSAGAAAFFFRSPAQATRTVNVYLDGALYATGRLGQAEDIVVRGPNGEENTVAFTADGVYMKHATCQNQLCIEQGMVTPANVSQRFYRNQILCLPNRVTVELVLTEEEAADLPDA